MFPPGPSPIPGGRAPHPCREAGGVRPPQDGFRRGEDNRYIFCLYFLLTSTILMIWRKIFIY